MTFQDRLRQASRRSTSYDERDALLLQAADCIDALETALQRARIALTFYRRDMQDTAKLHGARSRDYPACSKGAILEGPAGAFEAPCDCTLAQEGSAAPTT